MIPGKVVATYSNGDVSIDYQGLRNTDEPMQVDTSFDMGSVTKIMCTTSIVMLLVQSGKLSLRDTVATYLPEWSTKEKERITIKDLLEHQSGLNEWAPIYLKFSHKEEAHQYIASTPLKYPVGSGRRYSDLGFMTLGLIIETIYKKSLDEIFLHEIAKPLGLKSTQFKSPVALNNVAISSLGDRFEREMVMSGKPYPVDLEIPAHYQWRESYLSGEINDGNSFKVFNGISGHAGLFSTVTDMINYSRAFMTESTFFDPEVIRAFTLPGRDPIQGLGFRNWRNGTFIGHTGFPGVAIAIDIEHERAIALATNRLVSEGTPAPTDEILKEYLSDE